MARKKKSNNGLDDGFGDIEDSFFADGEDGDFWGDDDLGEGGGDSTGEELIEPEPPAEEAVSAPATEPTPPEPTPPEPTPPEPAAAPRPLPEMIQPDLSKLSANPTIIAMDFDEDIDIPDEQLAPPVPVPVEEHVVDIPDEPEAPAAADEAPTIGYDPLGLPEGPPPPLGFDEGGFETEALFDLPNSDPGVQGPAEEAPAEVQQVEEPSVPEPARPEPPVEEAPVAEQAPEMSASDPEPEAEAPVELSTPAPGPVASPPVAVPEAAAPAPEPTVEAPQSRPFVPPAGAAERWAEAAQTLQREAELEEDPTQSGGLFAEAGRIRFSRLGDWDGADQLFGLAVAVGAADADLLKAYADVVAYRGDFDTLKGLLQTRAGLTSGSTAAEALQDAALVERNSLGNVAASVQLLEQAMEQSADDWFALRLLRQTHYQTQNWAALETTLARMAELATGSRRAALLVERGRALEDHLGRPEDAAQAYRDAFRADAKHTPAFLAVERSAQAAGDLAGLAALYKVQAEVTQGAEKGWWLQRAAIAAARGDDVAAATVLFNAAAEAGGGSLELQEAQEAFLARTGQHEALALVLKTQAEAREGADRAHALARLARVQAQHLGAVDDAIASLKAALEADPGATPLVAELTLLLSSSGQDGEVLAMYEGQLASIGDAAQRMSLLFRMGEIAEHQLGDDAKAAAWYGEVADNMPGFVPAVDGLERVCERLGDWERYVGINENRAMLSATPQAQAERYHRAGVACRDHLGDAGRARACFEMALEADPDHEASLDALTRMLHDQGDHASLAAVLSNGAARLSDPMRAAALYYRAARVAVDRGGDLQQASGNLAACLEKSPGFGPAVALQRELAQAAGNWGKVHELYKAEAMASGSAWSYLAAAEASSRVDGLDPAADLAGLLQADPANPLALGLLARAARASGDAGGVVDVVRRRLEAASDDQDKARLATLLAAEARDGGDMMSSYSAISQALGLQGAQRPLGALSRLAESLNFFEEARTAVELSGDMGEAARMLETYSGDAQAAAESFSALLMMDPTDTEAAAGLERSLGRQGTHEGLDAAHAALADNLPDPPIRAVHALLAGHLMEAAGKVEQALKYYRIAFDTRSSQGKAFDALRRIYSAAGDADSLERLYGALPIPAPLSLAAALEEAGAPARAAAIYRGLLQEASQDGDSRKLLPLLVRLEQNLWAAEDYQAVLASLTRRRELLRSDDEIAAVDGQRRWLLATKLADSEEAWDAYQALLAESPDDVDVLQALVNIAQARGEADKAAQYLDRLSGLASDSTAAAAVQRRLADLLINNNELEKARQAYLKALDFHGEDLEALGGLKAIAQMEQNWQALVGVLAREATMLAPEQQLGRYREIATIWEEQIGDTAVAVDAWRKVIDSMPGDPEALSHMVKLCRSSGDWNGFVEHGQMLVVTLQGAERTDMMAELGKAFLEQLGNEEQAILFLDAASAGENPNLEAARILERIFGARGDAENVVQALVRQAAASEGKAAVDLLLRAAETRLESLHDRVGAAEVYAKILDVDPGNAAAMRFRGEFLYESGDLEAAVDLFRSLEQTESERDLDDFDERMEVGLYYFHFADALQRLRRSEGALERYERALELNPNHLPTLEAVGPVYVDTGSWDKAADVYQKILTLTGGQGDSQRVAEVYTRLGTIEARTGNQAKAKKRFNKALELVPNYIGALMGMAELLYERSDWNNLLNVYNNVIYHAQEPQHVVRAYLVKGFVLDAKMKMADKAAQHYEKSLAFDPAHVDAIVRLAELALRKQDWPEAAALADRALAVDHAGNPHVGELHLIKAIAFAACGDGMAARQCYTAAIGADTSLAEAIGGTIGPHERMHQVVRERLQAAP